MDPKRMPEIIGLIHLKLFEASLVSVVEVVHPLSWVLGLIKKARVKLYPNRQGLFLAQLTLAYP
jgi:hypothetical protein